MYWIVVKLTAHADFPVTHSDPITLKTYFDEAPGEHSDRSAAGDHYTVPMEHAIVIPSLTNARCWHRISEAEFDVGTYNFFAWVEPYASAAVGLDGEIAVGRVKLGRTDETYRGVASGAGVPLYAGVDPDDQLIVYELKLANSVIQYIVDEINTNRISGYVMRHLDMRDDNAIARGLQWPWALGEGLQKFITGWGPWDHKVHIGPVWGEYNRLGNAEPYYFYDYWSNIHYGFIMRMAGYSIDGLETASSIQNYADNFSVDSAYDTEPMRAGWQLAQAMGGDPHGRDVTRQDFINILNNHTHWDQRIRATAGAATRSPSTLQQFQDEMDRFDRMSPMEQIEMLQRAFGG